MPDLFDNPLGLDGFEFLEFSAPSKGVLETAFERMGFSLVARHRSKDVQLWRQGQINFVANYEPKSPAAYFATEHGPSACGMGFRVRDAAHRLCAGARARGRAGRRAERPDGAQHSRGPRHRRVADLPRRRATPTGCRIYDVDFVYEPGVAERDPPGAGLTTIDHLTHNVYDGRTGHWEEFYARDVRLPRVPPVRRHRRVLGPQHQGDDGPRRPDPHPDQRGRRERRKGPDRRVPADLQRRRHPAHRARQRRSLRLARQPAPERAASSPRPRPTPTTRCSRIGCPATASRSTG